MPVDGGRGELERNGPRTERQPTGEELRPKG